MLLPPHPGIVVAVYQIAVGRSSSPEYLRRYLGTFHLLGSCRGWSRGCRLGLSTLVVRASLVQNPPQPAAASLGDFCDDPAQLQLQPRTHRPLSAPAPAPRPARLPSPRHVADPRRIPVTTHDTSLPVCAIETRQLSRFSLGSQQQRAPSRRAVGKVGHDGASAAPRACYRSHSRVRRFHQQAEGLPHRARHEVRP